MSRLLHGVLGLALLVAIGYFTRPYFKQWLETRLKESEEYSKKESQKWKAAATNFDKITFDKPIMKLPKVDLSPKYRPRHSPPNTIQK